MCRPNNYKANQVIWWHRPFKLSTVGAHTRVLELGFIIVKHHSYYNHVISTNF